MFIYDTTIEDDEFGRVRLRTNVRARRIIIRAKSEGLVVTLPLGASPQEGMRCLLKHADVAQRLREQKQRTTRRIDFSYAVHTDMLDLTLEQSPDARFYCRRREGVIQLFCPAGADFDRLQTWLRKTLLEELRTQAKTILVRRTRELALAWGFNYSSLTIRTSQSRWGSCTSSNAINLSVYLMLVPRELADYVILHELCHTIHHDHSPRFWAKMDEVTQGRAKFLRARLRRYPTDL